jgi:magnesium transporter
VAELFDKYNLLSLPVVDEDGKLVGTITVDDIVSVLREG